MDNKNFDYGFLVKFKKETTPERRKAVRENLEGEFMVKSVSKVTFDHEEENKEEKETEPMRWDKPSTWKSSPKSFSKIPDKVFNIAILQLLSEKAGIRQDEIIKRAENLYRYNPKSPESDNEEEDED